MKTYTYLKAIFIISGIFICQGSFPDTYTEGPFVPHFNREQPRTGTISYSSADGAMKGNYIESAYLQPIDGGWDIRRDGGMAILEREFKVPFSWLDREFFVVIESATGPYRLFINDGFTGMNSSYSTPGEFRITGLTEEGLNKIRIEVTDNGSLKDIENGRSGSDLALTGRVYVHSQPRIRIRDFTVSTKASGVNANVELGIIVKTHLLNSKEFRVYFDLLDPDGENAARGYRDFELDMRREDTVRFFMNVPDARFWSHESPNLYTLNFRVQYEGRFTEYQSFKIGLREVSVEENKLRINHNLLPLSVTELFYDPGKGISRKELLNIKQDGYNTIILKGYPADEYLLQALDSVGLYLSNTADINTSGMSPDIRVNGNPSNDPRWVRAYTDRAMAMYHISKNHPSAIMFSPADNSYNGYNLYESYLRLKEAETTNRPVVYLPAGGQWNTDAVTKKAVNENNDILAERFILDIGKDPSHGIYRETSIINTDMGNGTVTVRNNCSVETFNGYVMVTTGSGKKTTVSRTDVIILPQQELTVKLPQEALTAKPGNVKIELKQK